MASIFWDRSTVEKLTKFKNNFTHGGKEGSPTLARRLIDDYVKHIFREHNQEADLLVNMGAEGQRKIVIDKCSNSESWKAVAPKTMVKVDAAW